MSNTDESDDGEANFASDHAFAFLTGESIGGYRLSSVELDMVIGNPSGTPPTYTVKLFSQNNDGDPGSELFTLSNPGSLSTGLNSFTAPSVNRLDPETAYFIVFDITGNTGADINGRLRTTASNDETGRTGWVIGNLRQVRPWNQAIWNSHDTHVPKYKLKGYETPPASPAPPNPPNMAYSPVQWNADDTAKSLAEHAFPLSLAEIESNRTKDGSGSLDLSGIDASLAPERAERSRGYYLSNRVYSPAEQSALVEQAPGGGYRIVGPDETRYQVVRGSPLVLVKLWHVYLRDSGLNGIERLGGPFFPRTDHLLAAPVELCLPAPEVQADAEAAIAVRIRGDDAWTVLESVERDGRLCADTVRVGWLIVVLATETEEEV
ncbi:MAG: hypothetical protein F4066_01760 [Chloroflexi bacterium]|nr:hypothetical protein [Chloroflexota bacterium]MYF82519.1 hypothetical protein [Chloroflexota bacterium]MYI03574.1 hypothetical protein [Chloroflexota bacterium]